MGYGVEHLFLCCLYVFFGEMSIQTLRPFLFIYLNLFIYLFIYFWLC